MKYEDNSMQALAVQVRRKSPAPSSVRAAVEERLTPLIRCVLRTGAGVPELVQWVRRTLPQLPSGNADLTAPRMARLLCAELFRQGRPLDTVLGRLSADTVAGL
jgi:hypothetical protein